MSKNIVASCCDYFLDIFPLLIYVCIFLEVLKSMESICEGNIVFLAFVFIFKHGGVVSWRWQFFPGENFLNFNFSLAIIIWWLDAKSAPLMALTSMSDRLNFLDKHTWSI